MSLIITEKDKGYSVNSLTQTSISKEVKDAFERMKYTLKWFRENRDLANAMPAIPELPLGSYIYPTVGNIHFTVPRSQSLINQIKALAWEEHGFALKAEEDNSKTNGSYMLRYVWSEQSWNYVYFTFNATMQGATCALIKIGEETKTEVVPIYEVVCEEGAKEEIWND